MQLKIIFSKHLSTFLSFLIKYKAINRVELGVLFTVFMSKFEWRQKRDHLDCDIISAELSIF